MKFSCTSKETQQKKHKEKDIGGVCGRGEGAFYMSVHLGPLSHHVGSITPLSM